MPFPRNFPRALVFLLTLALAATPLLAAGAGADDATVAKAKAAIAKGAAFLRKTQGEDGSWTPKAGPAVTALAVTALIDDPAVTAKDPAIQKALAYILSKAKEDGSIHTGVAENYNTAICLSALSRFNDDPAVAGKIKEGLAYLRSTQWSGQKDPAGKPIDEKHPFFGGFGYGKHGRPDLSNTQIAVQAFYDNNVECDKDPAMKRALAFVQRLQGVKGNDMFKDRIVQDGGAIYATSVSKDQVGVPQSFAGEEKGEDGVTRLRTYGSMTYAMFKTYAYARLAKDDPRVVEARKWIANNYTFDYNPGMDGEGRMHGYFYYLLTAARALDAFGEPSITTPDGKARSWRNDLAGKLVSLQREDGAWVGKADRWMEDDAGLVTAYAIIALQHAAK